MNEYHFMARVHCPYVFIRSVFLTSPSTSKLYIRSQWLSFIWSFIKKTYSVILRSKLSLSYILLLPRVWEFTISYLPKANIEILVSYDLGEHHTYIDPIPYLPLYMFHKGFFISISELIINLIYINNFYNNNKGDSNHTFL